MDKNRLLSLLGQEHSDRLRVFDVIPSTNTYLKENARSLPEGTAVLASGQTSGKGRLGRYFHSPAGKGVYLSMLLRPLLPPDRLGAVTAGAAVAVCDAVENACGTRPGIKWVNDLIMGGRKVCGILAEGTFADGRMTDIVLGAGVNVLDTPEDFTEGLSSTATSILMETGLETDLSALASQMILAFDRLRHDLPGSEGRYLELYRRDSVLLGKEVVFTRGGASYSGIASRIDDDFALVVETGGGPVRLTTGEVSVRPAQAL
ncbi:MAG: biotin--[Oscillospiraceae bacterium]|nr:biotin--[acetyl-CoA-carboxylase] ligase [Oscillospiraceae bacterium]